MNNDIKCKATYLQDGEKVELTAKGNMDLLMKLNFTYEYRDFVGTSEHREQYECDCSDNETCKECEWYHRLVNAKKELEDRINSPYYNIIVISELDPDNFFPMDIDFTDAVDVDEDFIAGKILEELQDREELPELKIEFF